MSYDVSLVNEDGPVTVNEYQEGGRYVLNGTYQAVKSITFNYSWFYYNILDPVVGLKGLDGQRAGDCIDKLEEAVNTLGTQQYTGNPFAPTPGNAGHALNILLTWAKEHPDATFTVH